MWHLEATSFSNHAPLLPVTSQVDVQFVRMTKRFIPLSEIKAHHLAHKADGGPLKNMMLFTRQRLSIQPLTQGKNLLWTLGAIPSERQPSLRELGSSTDGFFSLPFQHRGIWFCLEPGRGKATLRNWEQHSFYPARWCLFLNQRNSQVYLLNRSNKNMPARDSQLHRPLFWHVIFAYF